MKKKNHIALAIAAGVVLGVTGWQMVSYDRSGNDTIQPEQALENTVQEKRQELKDAAGTYNPTTIVLSDTDKDIAGSVAEQLGAEVRITSQGDYATLYLPDGVTIDDVYENEEYKSYIPQMEPDYYVYTSSIESSDGRHNRERIVERPYWEPDDEKYRYERHLDYVNMKDSWSTSKGSGVTVAVIDTGIDTDNPDFKGKISAQSYDASNDKKVADYGNEVIEDTVGHGTEVAGVLAAAMDNQSGIVGVAPDVDLLVIKCESDATGRFTRSSDLMFGLAYAIECDADVINMSFGTNVDIFSKYTKLAVNSDILCVAAAGNDASTMLSYPAADENVIGVGALDDDWELASYSNYGENIDLLAPGTVYTANIDDKYEYATGTSMSAPVVSAALALYAANHQDITYTDMCELLKASSTDLGVSGEDWTHSFGALDIHALLCEEKGTITYDMLTDEVENQTQIFVRNHTVQYMPEPERENVVFDGWYFDAQCTDECELYTEVFTEDVTLYAKWINEDEGSAYMYRTLSDGTAEITSYTGKRRYLTVPQTLEGYTVSSIGDGAFADNQKLRSVSLPQTITSVGNRAFQNCTALREMEIPSNVTTIGNQAFYGCARLTEMALDANGSLTSIGENAFAVCGLTSVTLPKGLMTLASNAFYGSTAMKKIAVADGNASYQVVNQALYDSTGTKLLYYPAGIAENYTIDSSTGEIGDYAFAYCQAGSVEIPEGVSQIGTASFQYSRLQSVKLPASVSSLGESAFHCCFSLCTAEFAKDASLWAIPMYCFGSCSSLREIVIPTNVEKIGGCAFTCSGLKKVSFEEGSKLDEIKQGSFSFTGIESIHIPAAVTSIGASAFQYCVSLSDVTFNGESACTVFGSYAFMQCTALADIQIPDSVTQVDERAFYGSGLENVTIGAHLTNLGKGAFSGCANLSAFQVSDGNIAYAAYDGVLYDREKTTLLMYPCAKKGTYTLPDTAERIAEYACADATLLTEVVFDEGLTEISGYAFSGCKTLENPALPTSLTTIGENAFEYCDGFDGRLTIPKKVVSIGRYAFYNDDSLDEIVIAAESEMSRIGYAAFAYSGISAFTVPGSVSSMGQEVFTGCKNLLTVTYEADSKLENLAAWTYQGADELRRITFEEGSSLTKIEAEALKGLPKLQKVDLSNCKNLTTIDNYAFYYCTGLEEFSIPDTVTEIGRYAFCGCSSLSSMDIPKNVERIGRYAFAYTKNINVYFKAAALPTRLEEYWDHSLAGYYLGKRDLIESGDWTYVLTESGEASVTGYRGTDSTIVLDQLDGHDVVYLGNDVFKDNQTLQTIQLPDTLQGIGRSAFENCSVTSLEIPDSVTTIGASAFQDSSVTSVTFGSDSKLVLLERYAFANTKQLESITIPAQVEKLSTYTFYKSAVKNVAFSVDSALTQIGDYAFCKSGLESITLPDTVQKIGYYAFSEASALQKTSLGQSSDLMLYGNAFYKAGLKEITIPKQVSYIGELCFTSCESLTKIEVASENAFYASVDGVLYDKSCKKLITCPAGMTGSYDVPDTVTSFAFGAFEQSKLSAVNIPSDTQLTTIGYRAFFRCTNLETIDIPDSVLGIEAYAFAYCDQLKSVNIGTTSQLGGIYQSAFYNCSSLTSVYIPEGVQEVSDYAFYGNTALTDVTFAENSKLTGIYAHAFEYAGHIDTFTMPENLDEIDEYAFNGTKIDTVVFNDTISYVGRYAFADSELADTTELVIPESVTFLGKGALKGASKVEKLTIPFFGEEEGDDEANTSHTLALLFGASRGSNTENSLKEISVLKGAVVPQNAMFEFNSLEKVSLPTTIVEVEYSALGYCFALRQVSGLDNVTSIGDSAFENDWKLEDIGTLSNLRIIKERAFSGCSSYTNEALIVNVNRIGMQAFYGSGLSGELNIPSTITEIGTAAFSSCSSLEAIHVSQDNPNFSSRDGILYDKEYTNILSVPGSITGSVIVPGTVNEISAFAFAKCGKLEKVTIEDGVTTIGQGAFSGCRSLLEVTMADSVLKMGGQSFTDCASLENVRLGNQIKMLSTSVFYGCGNLENIVLPDSVETIEQYAFWGCSSIDIINIPCNVKELNGSAFYGCDSLSYFDVDTSNPYFTTCDGIIYDKDMTKIVAVPKAIAGSITIPDGVSEIGEGAFLNCENLQSVTMPDSLSVINAEAFRNCTSLTEINMSNQITDIGLSAFEDTGYWQDKLNWDNGVLYIGNYLVAFRSYQSKCDGYIIVREGTKLIADYGLSGNGSSYDTIKGIILPDTVEVLGDAAFCANKQMKFIRMSTGIKEYGSVMVSECENLKTMYVNGKAKIINGIGFDGESLRSVRLNTSVSSNCLEITSELETLSVVYSKCNLMSYVYRAPQNIVISSTDTMDTNFLSGINDSNIYCYVEKDQWPEGWNHGNKTYYKDDWHLATFYINDVIVSMDPIVKGGVVQSPSDSEITDYLMPGQTFLGWDIDGDGAVDDVPATLTEDLEAKAVLSTPITTLTVDESATLEAGETKALTVKCAPVYHNDSEEYTWASSDEQVATVDETGKITAVSEGTADVTVSLANNSEVSATCTVTVTPVEYGVKLSEKAGTRNVGETLQLEPKTVLPEDSGLSGTDIQYTSSDSSVANVSADGLVTAIAPGDSTITVSCGEYTVEYALTVLAPLEKITVNGTSDTMNVGDTQQFTIGYSPENTTDDKSITWRSSDTSKLTIDDTGLATAVAPGKVKVQTLVNGKYAAFELEVKAPLQWITLNTSTGTMRLDRTKQLDVIYEPANTTDDKSVTWTSGDEEIASVDENGLVTAKKAGETVITGQVGECTATYEVTVVGLRDETTGIIVTNSDDTKMDDGMSLDVREKKRDSFDDTYKDAWGHIEEHLRDEHHHRPQMDIYDITLNEGGEAVQPDRTVDVEIPLPPNTRTDGYCVYRLEEDGSLTDMNAEYKDGRFVFQTEHFSVYVLGTKSNDIEVTEIALDQTEMKLCPGQTEALTAAVSPQDATDTSLVWSSSDNTVAAVSSAGAVTAVGDGTADITVTSWQNSDVTATCTVTVGHTAETDKAVASTCTKAGLTAGSHCSVCGEVLEKQEKVEVLGHIEVTDKAVASTCTKAGLTTGSHCAICGEVLEKQEEVEALGHTEVTDKAVASTCTKAGLTAGSHCSVCGEVLEKQEKVEALGHTAEKDKAVASTCTKAGLTAGSHCSVCGEVLEKQEEVEALGHTAVTDKAVAPTYTETGLTEGSHCSVCGEVLIKQEIIEPIGTPTPVPTPTASAEVTPVVTTMVPQPTSAVTPMATPTSLPDPVATASPDVQASEKPVMPTPGAVVSASPVPGKVVTPSPVPHVTEEPGATEVPAKETTLIETPMPVVSQEGTASDTTQISEPGDVSGLQADQPSRVTGVKCKHKKKKLTVSWKGEAADGYQIQYAVNRKFSKKKKTLTVKGDTTKKTLKHLKKNKKYYVRVRAFYKSNGGKKYGAWSKVKKIRIRK